MYAKDIAAGEGSPIQSSSKNSSLPEGYRLGAVTFIQRFGKALNPHFHFHSCIIDGVFDKLKKVNEWAKQIRYEKPMKEIWQIFKAKLRGHIQYYGVSHNSEEVKTFLYKATRIVFKWLNRRSQRKSFVWDKFRMFMTTDPLPTVKTVHPLFVTRTK